MKKTLPLLLIALLIIPSAFLTAGEREEVVMPEVENVVVINGMPVIIPDPGQAMDWYDTQVVYNLYSPLIYPTPDGGLRPHLAESWETVGGKLDHWRFKLRRGVLFHDGSELTAEDVAFSMEVDEISDPVLTQFGYHVIKLTEHRESSTATFEEVREKLATDLRNRLINKMINQKIDDLKQSARIEILFKPTQPGTQQP